jgi:hypothetical protein
MAYGHAERNLALIRQLEAETRQLLESLDQPDSEQSAWLREGGLSGGSGTAAHPADHLVGGNAVPVGELPDLLPRNRIGVRAVYQGIQQLVARLPHRHSRDGRGRAQTAGRRPVLRTRRGRQRVRMGQGPGLRPAAPDRGRLAGRALPVVNRTILRHSPGQTLIPVSGRWRLPEKRVEKSACPTTPAPPFPGRSGGDAKPGRYRRRR